MPKPDDETVLTILAILDLLGKRKNARGSGCELSNVARRLAAAPHQIACTVCAD
jgi:hypothetical protein